MLPVTGNRGVLGDDSPIIVENPDPGLPQGQPGASFGPALFEGGTAMSHVRLIMLAPFVGSVIAVVIRMNTRTTTEMPEEAVAGSERESGFNT